MTGRIGGLILFIAASAASAACAAKVFTPPTGPGTPFPDAAATWTQLTEGCRGVRLFVAEIRVGGWVGATREPAPATMHGALTRSDDIYLEVPVPFGRPALQLSGRAGRAVLLLPRAEQVLRGSAREIVEAMTGLNWGARDLLDVLTGCVGEAPTAVSGQQFKDRAALDLGAGVRAWLRRTGGVWHLDAASRNGLLVHYLAREGSFPSVVRVTAAAADLTPLDLTFHISNRQTNVDLDTDPFALPVPPGFAPITIEDLRAVRPWKDAKGGS